MDKGPCSLSWGHTWGSGGARRGVRNARVSGSRRTNARPSCRRLLLSVHRDFWSRFGFTGKPPREQGEPPHTPHPVPPRSVSLPRGTSGAGAGQTPHAAARCRSLPLAEAHGALRLRLPGPAPHLAASAPRQCDGPCFRRRRQFGGVLDWRFGECFPAWVWAGGGRHICPLGSSPSTLTLVAGLTECASFPAVSPPPPHSLFPFGRESPCTVPVSGWGFSFPSRRGEQRRDLPVWEESFARSSPCGPSYFWEQKCRFHTSASASPLLGRSRVSSAILVVW